MFGQFTSGATRVDGQIVKVNGQIVWTLSFEADSGDIYTVGTYTTPAESKALKASFVPDAPTSHDSQVASQRFFDRDADTDSTGGVWH